jgi:DNA polymerase I-like protein with 3'-5' exonuclease and polymerase domains
MLLKKHGEPVPDHGSPRLQPGFGKTQRIQMVRNIEQIQPRLKPGATVSILVAEQPADLFGATTAAVGIYDGKNTVVLPNPSREALDSVAKMLSQTEKIITHDLKRLMHQLSLSTVYRLPSTNFDTMIASYLLASGSRAHDLPGAMHGFLGRSVEVPATFVKEKDYERFGQVVAALPELAQNMEKELEKAGSTKVFPRGRPIDSTARVAASRSATASDTAFSPSAVLS